ncbi:MAG: hypothetical protein F6K30_30505 [Cyanothece sp. SIO2G6]|nr:hypothetical protein [Cyanothece sp. SIO2G6]
MPNLEMRWVKTPPLHAAIAQPLCQFRDLLENKVPGEWRRAQPTATLLWYLFCQIVMRC